MTEGPQVSVVISTYQRAGRLPCLVAGLAAQSLPTTEFEVVIVDNGATDDTASVLDRLSADAPFELRVVTLHPNQGPSGGRNAGWRAARGNVVAFTDDDCAPEPDWLRAGLAALSAEGGIVAGRTIPDPEQLGHRGPFSRTQDVKDTRFLQTCNVFYLRDDLVAVDGFDAVGIRAKGGEDTDLGWRIEEQLGRRAVFAADAIVRHDVSPSSYRAALREAATWVDIPRVVARDPERARALFHRRVFWRPAHATATVALLGIASAGVSRRWAPAILGLVPYVHFRLRRQRVGRTRQEAVVLLPAQLVIDVIEVVTMVRGSIRHRTLVL